MMKKYLCVLSLFMMLTAWLVSSVQVVIAEANNDNLVTDGDFEAFLNDDDIILPELFDFNAYGMGTLTHAGNSRAVITLHEENPVARLQYDGVSEGDNSNMWIFTSMLAQGEGTYTISFDLKALGLSVDDFIGITLLGSEPDNHLGLPIAMNQAEYEALEDSENLDGWKHFSFTFTQNASQGTTNDTLVFDLFNKKDEAIVLYLDNISMMKDDVELLKVDDTYVGDFSVYFDDEFVLSTEPAFGYGSFPWDSPGRVIRDGDEKVMQLRYAGDGRPYSSFIKYVDFEKPGVYAISFDLKYPDTLDTDDIGLRFLGPNPTANSSILSIASSIDDLNILEAHPDREGYRVFSGTLFVDMFTSTNIDSLLIWFNTKGIAENYILIDNLEIILISELEPTPTPSTEGLHFNHMVLGGDFETMEENYTFVSEPTDESYFWGTFHLDSPGLITNLDGNQVLQLVHDGEREHGFASAFVFLEKLHMNNEDIYRLTFDFKPVFDEGYDVDTAFHVSFVGPTGQENHKAYLNYLDEPYRFTNGINPESYPFEIETLEEGWLRFNMVFQMNITFLTTVDSIRFLVNTDMNPENTVYIDNVEFGIYTEEPIPDLNPDPDPDPDPDPADPGDEEGTGGCFGTTSYSHWSTLTVSLIMLAAIPVIVKVLKGGRMH